VPAQALDALNDNIIGTIEVIQSFLENNKNGT
jgi:hypothetical protein